MSRNHANIAASAETSSLTSQTRSGPTPNGSVANNGRPTQSGIEHSDTQPSAVMTVTYTNDPNVRAFHEALSVPQSNEARHQGPN